MSFSSSNKHNKDYSVCWMKLVCNDLWCLAPIMLNIILNIVIGRVCNLEIVKVQTVVTQGLSVLKLGVDYMIQQSTVGLQKASLQESTTFRFMLLFKSGSFKDGNLRQFGVKGQYKQYCSYLSSCELDDSKLSLSK